MLTFKAGHRWQGEDKVIIPNGDTSNIMVRIHAVASVHDKNKVKHFYSLFLILLNKKWQKRNY
jgi:hypothetical protein